MDELTGPSAPPLALAAGFPAADRAAWRTAVDKVLARSAGPDADLDEAFARTLVHRTDDGVEVQPIYSRADVEPVAAAPGQAPFHRGRRPEGHRLGWDVRQRFDHHDPAVTRAEVLADLEGGVSSLWLAVGPGGLAVDDMATALDGVYLDLVAVALDGPADAVVAAAAELARLAGTADVEADRLTGSLGLDPLGAEVAGGGPWSPAALADRVAAGRRHLPSVRPVVVDGLVPAALGASDGQELAYLVTAGVEYVQALVAGGVDRVDAPDLLEFRLSATPEQFATMAKLRAARWLWWRACTALGFGPPEGVAQLQHAVTAPTWYTARDPWVNVLRATTAAFAAAVGGADAVTVLPHDRVVGHPDRLARRVARNVQTVLADESNLARVLDPGGGSWYVERHTADVAAAGWAEVRRIEAAGGLTAAWRSGLVPEAIAAGAEQRARRVARRRDPVTGVSEFPDVAEAVLERPERRERPGDVRWGGRRGASFEALRDRSDAHRDRTGDRPGVVLVALGPPAAHIARQTFAKNLFEAGGLETVTVTAVEVDALEAALHDAGTTVACLCSSDPVYAEAAPVAAGALRDAGATRVLVAGRPQAVLDELRADGVEPVAMGDDVLALLTDLLDHLEVP